MKNTLILCIALFIFSRANATLSGNGKTTIQQNKLAIIDASDTVVFDLTHAALVGNDWSFPVYILSDDTVNSLDFSFKYDHSKLTYDSVSDLTTYMQPLAYYNSFDSTVRFTSNSFQRYANNTDLVRVHFTLLSGQMNAASLFTIKVYLNGNTCSQFKSNLIATGIESNKNRRDGFELFPNPTHNEFFISGLLPEEKSEIVIYTPFGEIAYKSIVNKNSIYINAESLNLESGVYFINVSTESSISFKKLILTK